MAGLRLGVVVVAGLLQQQVGPRTHEGVWRILALDNRLDMFEAGIQTTEKVKNLTGLGDGMANIAQIVDEVFELGAVVVDAHVALLKTAKLGFEIDGTLELVVAEQSLNVTLESKGRVMWLMNNVEDRFLDSVVKPIDDAMIDLSPFRRALSKRRRGANMVGDAKFAKDGLEKAPPLAIVGFLELKEDRDMRTNVHHLKNSGRNGLGIELAVGVRSGGGHGGRRNRGSWRCRRCESKRIDQGGITSH
jgi:hypothetical protein